MAEQRVNAAGETVEYNENTDRWEPVRGEESKQTAETSNPVPTKDETLVEEGEKTPRRAKADK